MKITNVCSVANLATLMNLCSFYLLRLTLVRLTLRATLAPPILTRGTRPLPTLRLLVPPPAYDRKNKQNNLNSQTILLRELKRTTLNNLNFLKKLTET